MLAKTRTEILNFYIRMHRSRPSLFQYSRGSYLTMQWAWLWPVVGPWYYEFDRNFIWYTRYPKDSALEKDCDEYAAAESEDEIGFETRPQSPIQWQIGLGASLERLW
jgi:hypothetical protein